MGSAVCSSHLPQKTPGSSSRVSLSAAAARGLMSRSRTVCKFKAHKRCAVRATNDCKWTTLASIGKDIIEDEDGVGSGLPALRGRPLLLPAPGTQAADPLPPPGLCSDLFLWV